MPKKALNNKPIQMRKLISNKKPISTRKLNLEQTLILG